MALKLPTPVAAYLRQHHVMTLATQGADGPWAAAVFYAEDGDDLVFVSSPNSRHCHDLAQEPRCAAAIHADAADWRSIQGIQLEGAVSALEGAAEPSDWTRATAKALRGRAGGDLASAGPRALVPPAHRAAVFRRQPLGLRATPAVRRLKPCAGRVRVGLATGTPVRKLPAMLQSTSMQPKR